MTYITVCSRICARTLPPGYHCSPRSPLSPFSPCNIQQSKFVMNLQLKTKMKKKLYVGQHFLKFIWIHSILCKNVAGYRIPSYIFGWQALLIWIQWKVIRKPDTFISQLSFHIISDLLELILYIAIYVIRLVPCLNSLPSCESGRYLFSIFSG